MKEGSDKASNDKEPHYDVYTGDFVENIIHGNGVFVTYCGM